MTAADAHARSGCDGVRVRGWEWPALGAAALVLWVLALDVPVPVGEGLDSSWQGALVDAWLQKRQFGLEVVSPYGPWGWLVSHAFLPGAVVPKLLWEVFGKALMVAVLVGSAVCLPPWRRWLLVALAAAFVGWMFDPFFVLIVVLLVSRWVFRPGVRPWLAAAAVVGLGFIAQVKFTYAVLAIIGMAMACLSLSWRGRARRAGVLAAGFAVAYVLWWLAAGQHPANLADHWHYSLEIVRGYAQAMALDEPLAVFLAGAALAAGLCGLLIGAAVRPAGDLRLVWPLVAFLGGALFLSWKHGFTRADGHAAGFFLTVLLVGPWLQPLLRGRLRPALGDLILVLGPLGMALAEPAATMGSVSGLGNRLRARVHVLSILPSAPSRFEEVFAYAAAHHGIPGVREVVGSATTDCVSYNQGLLLLNGMDYRPRPRLQSYGAYTPALLALNHSFMRSARAPEYYLVRIQTIDGRHPMQDDALLLAELPRWYEYVALRDGFAVFRRRPVPAAGDLLARRDLFRHEGGLGQEIPLPAAREHPHWVRIEARLSLLGRLRAAVYKPPTAYLVIQEETGERSRWRLVPEAAREGFLLQPLVLALEDYVQYAQERAGRSVASIRIEPATPRQGRYWTGASVVVSSVPGMARDPRAR